MKLSEKVALITRDTSGIGLETATLFQSEGARVIVTGVNQAGLGMQRHASLEAMQ